MCILFCSITKLKKKISIFFKYHVFSCVHNFNQAYNINITFLYAECGIKNTGNESSLQLQFHLQIIVMFEQEDKTQSIQSFIAQCGQQRVQYQKQAIPKRIEEALEELKLVPTRLEQKAPVPEPMMRIVTDIEHHKPGDGIEINQVNVGESLRLEFNLEPESGLFYFKKITKKLSVFSNLGHRQSFC